MGLCCSKVVTGQKIDYGEYIESRTYVNRESNIRHPENQSNPSPNTAPPFQVINNPDHSQIILNYQQLLIDASLQITNPPVLQTSNDPSTIHQNRFRPIQVNVEDQNKENFTVLCENKPEQQKEKDQQQVLQGLNDPRTIHQNGFRHIQVDTVLRVKQPDKQNEKNRAMLQTIMQDLDVPYELDTNNVYSLQEITSDTNAYIFVLNIFRNRKFERNYRITKIQRIQNPYTYAQYQLKKYQLGSDFKEQYLFHGTGQDAAKLIFKENFNWRIIVNKKFGCGVSFANNPWYASHYSLKKYSGHGDYIMILAKVLVETASLSIGCDTTIIPLTGSTTTNHSREVIVKYDDSTFYPEYIVYFQENLRTPNYTNFRSPAMFPPQRLYVDPWSIYNYY